MGFCNFVLKNKKGVTKKVPSGVGGRGKYLGKIKVAAKKPRTRYDF